MGRSRTTHANFREVLFFKPLTTKNRKQTIISTYLVSVRCSEVIIMIDFFSSAFVIAQPFYPIAAQTFILTSVSVSVTVVTSPHKCSSEGSIDQSINRKQIYYITAHLNAETFVVMTVLLRNILGLFPRFFGRQCLASTVSKQQCPANFARRRDTDHLGMPHVRRRSS